MNLKSLTRIGVRYGLIAGFLIAILMVAMFYIGRHPFLVAPFLDFRILVFGVFIFFTLKEFRDYHQGGLLYFWQGLIGSYMVILVSLLIACLGLYVFGVVEPGFVQQYVAQMESYLRSFPTENIDQIGKDIYERNLKSLPATKVSDLVTTYFFQGIVIGAFLSIILAIILRRTTN